ncbi:hypothetical protein [Mycolicibacterium llatzerense]|uniref:hypothetical protein n=1 Tax=Mycolicibacterium llatzerense TaxID=280871 RepID=UPI0021B4F691|nr:hypothetical protein [Mycolicibacterium llatzerense]
MESHLMPVAVVVGFGDLHAGHGSAAARQIVVNEDKGVVVPVFGSEMSGETANLAYLSP